MSKHYLITILLLFSAFSLSSKTYFIAIDGDDSNSGTKTSPFATLKKAHSIASAGDSVLIRGGTYKITEGQIMRYSDNGLWAYVFDMHKSGSGESNRIYYGGYGSERPIFDLSEVKPEGNRVIVFYVSGSFLHFENFEVVGTQVTIIGHTQSECFRNEGGNHNIYENLAMHDGMAIGFYLVNGADNLVVNCDAYNNYDYLSDGGVGGNVDGFGGHPKNQESTGNVFRACRAWYNSDDGFDLINAHAAYTIENCWAFYNGYQPGTFERAGNGAGFKSGGYGMSEFPDPPEKIPMHVVRNCLAYYNLNQGFYSNHHLGGIRWENNTGYQNPSNFNMLNRKSVDEAVNVPGYEHILKNNVSHDFRRTGHISNVNKGLCEISNNSFLPNEIPVTDNDFISLDPSELTRSRKSDGSLPDIGFLKPRPKSTLSTARMGYTFKTKYEVP
ncbi:DUF4990 domain-containing protein [Echinicola jeungdonensis]|uniref:Rhamnogalacturonan lyase domain-containing protein n=1 Tax=Echinicola jeungdonensis TaxID=709343 RepID=A0ABV5J5D2_9BACT|nr:DUF4990 domain-containing protein [Echinicola jeungdonensis]MDN3669628.1 DUF4990 domain-containing protein [Echinicola jeungdonensis]